MKGEQDDSANLSDKSVHGGGTSGGGWTGEKH